MWQGAGPQMSCTHSTLPCFPHCHTTHHQSTHLGLGTRHSLLPAPQPTQMGPHCRQQHYTASPRQLLGTLVVCSHLHIRIRVRLSVGLWEEKDFTPLRRVAASTANLVLPCTWVIRFTVPPEHWVSVSLAAWHDAAPDAEVFPDSQSSHLAAFCPENVPAAQEEQERPAVPANLPASHSLHITPDENSPTVQSSHLVPSAFGTEPVVLQLTQIEPNCVVTLPNGHSVHKLEPMCANFPASQKIQSSLLPLPTP